MKNSIILNFILFLLNKILEIYNGSVFEKIINNICLYFKRISEKSVICSFFKNPSKILDYWQNSFFFSLILIPFKLLFKISQKAKVLFENLSKTSSLKTLISKFLYIPVCKMAHLGVLFSFGMVLGIVIFNKISFLNIGLGVGLLVISLLSMMIKPNIHTIFSTSIIFKFFLKFFNKFEIANSEKTTENFSVNKGLCVVSLILGIISAISEPVIFLISLICVIFVIAVFYNTLIGVFTLVFLAPIMPTSVCILLAGLCILSFILNLILGRFRLISFNGLDFFVICFLLLAGFCSLTGFNPQKSAVSLIVYIAFICVYFIIVNTVKTKNQWHNLLVLFVISGFLVGLYGVYQNFFITATDTSWIDEDMFSSIGTRVYSTFDNPNVLGQYLILLVPVMFALFWSEKKPTIKVIYLCMLVCTFGCLIFTWSRAAWVGVILALGFFLVLKDRRWASLLVLALFILPFILPDDIINRLTSIGNLKDSSTAYRVSVWIASLRIALDYFITGIGLGSGAFERVYHTYALNGAGFALHAHNFYIQLVVEMGVLGLILFLLIIISAYKKIIASALAPRVFATVSLAMGGALLGYLFSGVAENLWYNHRMVLIFWIFMALLQSGVNVFESEKSYTLKSVGIKQ